MVGAQANQMSRHPAIQALIRDHMHGLIDIRWTLHQLIDARPELLVLDEERLKRFWRKFRRPDQARKYVGPLY
jgi:hypothetical protein